MTFDTKYGIMLKDKLFKAVCVMAISFSDEFNISNKVMKSLGVFDCILDLDTRFFIDPALLELCIEPEFINAKSKVEKYFSNIIVLLRHSKQKGDIYWKKADALLTFKEITGTCIGYSKSGTRGNAIGAALRYSMLSTIKELVDVGEEDPVLFELLGVFQEHIGCDRISDLITFIIWDDILKYTQRIVSKLKISDYLLKLNSTSYNVCYNTYNKQPILLLPSVILSPLPVAESFEDIDFVCNENERVRSEINKYFDWDKRNEIRKSDIMRYLKISNDFRKALIDAYKNIPKGKYDFSESSSGEYVWYAAAKEYTEKYPLRLVYLSNGNITDVEGVTVNICNQFKSLIENNGLNQLLYDSANNPKHEPAAQLLFYGIADSYCKANDIDLSREINNGRGPVDFKLSKGARDKILVEVKLTSNPQLEHGILKQLPIYMQQEDTQRAIYLIIDNGHKKKRDKLVNLYNSFDDTQKEKIKIILIDATIKPSASKA